MSAVSELAPGGAVGVGDPAAGELALSPAFPAPGSRWVHVKRGTTYVVVGTGRREATNEPTVYYRRSGDAGWTAVWSRPTAEWLDGRFRPVPDDRAEERATLVECRREYVVLAAGMALLCAPLLGWRAAWVGLLGLGVGELVSRAILAAVRRQAARRAGEGGCP